MAPTEFAAAVPNSSTPADQHCCCWRSAEVAEDTVAAENQSIAAGSEAAGTVASPEKLSIGQFGVK